MFTVVVLSLFYIGSANMYTDADFEQRLKEIIKDRKRRKEIKVSLSEFRDYQKSFDAKLTYEVENLNILADGYDVPIAGMNEVFERMVGFYDEYYEQKITYRITVAGMLTDEEWAKMKETYQNDQDFILMARERRRGLLKEEMETLIGAIEKGSDREDRVAQAREIVNDIEGLFLDFYKDSNQINFVDNEVLSHRTSSAQQLDEVYDDWTDERRKFYSDFLGKVVELADTFNGEEWTKIGAEIEDAFN